MKHVDMLPLMGKVVTVHTELVCIEEHRRKWTSQKCSQWAGWIVGFTYKMDGYRDIERGEFNEFMGSTFFVETFRQLCVLVKPWPTKKAEPVPLDGYTMGGEPEPPDYGGWRNYRRHEALKVE